MLRFTNGVVIDGVARVENRLLCREAVEDLGIGELGELGRENVYEGSPNCLGMFPVKYGQAGHGGGLLDGSHH